ncbi:hypothetical protein FCL40_10345 [Ferrimonas sediminicola]|uniref:Lipoprotein n=1 Tax=Ferrimonas sediminicola TaxID=2569538 RepID=A0A4U1BF87_9GAMM|nr:hypothetical protein [Ferrimonas sediminicola]TKB49030.1 hypothetical protein FCL40_10345 [Ferrimonas sediminicola]
MKTHWIAVTCMGLLTACGGGGGASSPDPSPLPPSTELTISRTLASDPSAALVATVTGIDSRELDFRWSQISGPQVNILNPSSPMAAFEAPEPGLYEFRITVTDSQGNAISEVVDHSTDTAADAGRIRGDQVVPSGGRVSMRLGRSGDRSQAMQGIRWQQQAGPRIGDLAFDDPELLTFTAPVVTRDTLLTLSVTASDNGRPVSDQALVLVTAEPSPANDALFDGPVARVQAWDDRSPWKAALERCVYSTRFNASSLCSIDTLPLLGQQHPVPTVDQVMERVVVSHPWMGDAFKGFLQQRDPSGDFRRLLGAVTAVVISADIRPSFYWVATGAIYLDPSDLWLEPWQMATINEDPDYRSGFGSELNFLTPWRYVKGNAYASVSYPPYAEISRSLGALESELASLLYHELAHANDFFPSSTWDSIDTPTLLQAYYLRSEQQQLISDRLTADLPLHSSEMKALADVQFRGATATPLQKSYQPGDIAAFFSSDRANDDYAYSTPREDLAMLFEEAMMAHRYGIRRDVAVTDRPDQVSASTISVSWGQRGRIADAPLLPRLDLVLTQLMPSLEADRLISALPASIPMRAGESWADNLTLDPAAAAARVLARPSLTRPREGVLRHLGRTPDWKLEQQ